MFQVAGWRSQGHEFKPLSWHWNNSRWVDSVFHPSQSAKWVPAYWQQEHCISSAAVLPGTMQPAATGCIQNQNIISSFNSHLSLGFSIQNHSLSLERQKQILIRDDIRLTHLIGSTNDQGRAGWITSSILWDDWRHASSHYNNSEISRKSDAKYCWRTSRTNIEGCWPHLFTSFMRIHLHSRSSCTDCLLWLWLRVSGSCPIQHLLAVICSDVEVPLA